MTGERRVEAARTTDPAELVRTMRRRARMAQRDLASASDVAQSAVCAFETGRRVPSLTVLRRLAGAVGLEVELGLVRVDVPARRLTGPLGEQVLAAREELLELLGERGLTRVWVVGDVAAGAECVWDAVELVALGVPEDFRARQTVLGYLSMVLPVRTTLASAEAWRSPDGRLVVPPDAVELVLRTPTPAQPAAHDDLLDHDDPVDRRWAGPGVRRAVV